MGIYWNLCGAGASLNSIVMVGTHDAGINKGKWYARTQKHDIWHQAYNGVRMFDLRIAAGTSGGTTGGVKNAELRSYHADGPAKKQETKTRYLEDLGRNQQLERSSIRMGTFGDSLQSMIDQAKNYVESEPNEFLILKFDKCLNWALVAEACVTLLGNRIYKGGGDLNIKTLDDLKGKVICVFTQDGLNAIGNQYGPADGILGIRNLNGSAGGYHAGYEGLQYFGKGGTSLTGLTPTSENKKKQRGLMVAGVGSDPRAMGMMYWTSTGLLGNVRFRNWMMWKGSNRAALKATWNTGLQAAIDDRLNGQNVLDGGGNLLKTFMPNIVMIDFANSDRCSLILDLNNVAAHELAQAAQFVAAQGLDAAG